MADTFVFGGITMTVPNHSVGCLCFACSCWIKHERFRLSNECVMLRSENDKLRDRSREVVAGRWCVTDLQESIGDV